jgi:folylpolyglutamate synthase/dihydropteroate synthase
MNYPQCLLYLEQVQTLGIKFGLENVRAVLGALGNPEERYAGVVVAGSNGKGSVCAMLSRILTVSGYKAGLYTSPHLIDPEERIRINGEPIDRGAFCRSLTAVREAVERLIAERTLLSSPTYFETMTCQALHAFAGAGVDVAILEVGMGGRFDATNVIIPVVSIITTISGEHQKFLGDTLARIAFEKAGIVKEGVPVVCGVEPDQAFDVIEARAAELKAPFIPVFRDGRVLRATKREFGYSFIYGGLPEEGSARKDQTAASRSSNNPEGRVPRACPWVNVKAPVGRRAKLVSCILVPRHKPWVSTQFKSKAPDLKEREAGSFEDGSSMPRSRPDSAGGEARSGCSKTDGCQYTNKYIMSREKYEYTPSLPGLHQGKNAAVAIRAAEVIGARWKPNQNSAAGDSSPCLTKADIIEGIETTSWPGRLEMVSKDPLIVMDGAHNEEGARALRAYADEFLPKPLTLIYAAMKDKAVEKIAAILFPAAGRIILTSFPYFKAHTPEELLARTPESLRPRCTLEPNPPLALKMGTGPISAQNGDRSNFRPKWGQVQFPPKMGTGPIFSGTLLIAGSLFLVGEMKKVLARKEYKANI